MEAAPAGGVRSRPERPPPLEQPQRAIFRQYYTESDYFVSPEGILKILGAVACVVWAVVLAGAGGCAGARGVAGGVVGVWLAVGAATALLHLGVLLGAPLRAPQAWLYTDIIVSSVSGVVLLVSAALRTTLCELERALDYAHGPLAIVSAGMVTGSAVITYVTVMRQWDASRTRREPARPPAADQDV